MKNLTQFTDSYLDSSIPKVNCPNCMSVSPKIIEAAQLPSYIKVIRQCNRCGSTFAMRYPITMSIGGAIPSKETPQRPRSNTFSNKQRVEKEEPLPVVKIDESLFKPSPRKSKSVMKEEPTVMQNTSNVEDSTEETVTPWGKEITNMPKWKRKCRHDRTSDALWNFSLLGLALVIALTTYFCVELCCDYKYNAIACMIYTLIIGLPLVGIMMFLSIVYTLRGTAFGKY